MTDKLGQLKWYPLNRIGNYLAWYSGCVMCCPMLADGSRAGDEEIGEFIDEEDGEGVKMLAEALGQGLDDQDCRKLLVGLHLKRLADVVKEMWDLWEAHDCLNDEVNIENLVPMSLDEWYHEITAKADEIMMSQ